MIRLALVLAAVVGLWLYATPGAVATLRRRPWGPIGDGGSCACGGRS